ncbi:MAG: radical SAM protein [Methanomassiliicoccales archaeon]
MPLDFTMRYVSKLADRVADSVSFERVTRIEDVVPDGMDQVALNIRIPFCAFKCTYCALPGQSYDERQAEVFLAAVRKELRLYSSYLQRPKIERVYLSGGTPSLMHKDMGFLLGLVEEEFNKPPTVAMEASPADLSPEVLVSLKETGVSQLSVGVQTFDEQLLRNCLGRNISREKLVSTLRRVMEAGFDYVNIDLMFSLPGQTVDLIRQDLDVACELGVHGISTFPLMLLPYTQLTKRLQKKTVTKGKVRSDAPLQDPLVERQHYSVILEILRSRGYEMRTLWSFSTDPDAYEGPYEHSEFVGIGPRAWGMVGSNLTLNTPDIPNYLALLEEGFLPLYAYSPLKDYPTGRFARRLYHGKIAKVEAKILVEEDPKVGRIINMMKLLGLMKEENNAMVLTDKALALGSVATKRIAMATLAKMNEAIREAGIQGPQVGETSAAPEVLALFGAE